MKKQFGEDRIIILLGAGASCDAGMKNSLQMIADIEGHLKDDWKEYAALYNYIQSSHYHLERLKGVESKNIIFNIEHLVGLLNVIINVADKNVDVYPFIGSWEKDLINVAGQDFGLAKSFKEKILIQLKDNWLTPDNYKAKSVYYKKLLETQYYARLRIFSLNYDMCVEENFAGTKHLERGFNDDRKWDYRLYEPNDLETQYYLYKLHGSLDWKRDNEKRLTFADSLTSVKPIEMEIIFGVQNKLQAYDPYMFYFYSFREACIKAELIVISGYGFYDTHINENLIGAIKNDSNKQLLVNVYERDATSTPTSDDKIKADLIGKLGVSAANLTIFNGCAREFFNEKMNVDYFASIFPEQDSEIEVLPATNDEDNEL
jgi:hypothetical protein